MADPGGHAVVLRLGLGAGECDDVVKAATDALASGFGLTVVVDDGAGVAATNAMARIALHARRLGSPVRFVAGPGMAGLIALCGLDDVLDVSAHPTDGPAGG